MKGVASEVQKKLMPTPENRPLAMPAALPSDASAEALLARLGKHRMGTACLYVKKLDDIDLDVLADLIELSVTRLQREYGTSA